MVSNDIKPLMELHQPASPSFLWGIFSVFKEPRFPRIFSHCLPFYDHLAAFFSKGSPEGPLEGFLLNFSPRFLPFLTPASGDDPPANSEFSLVWLTFFSKANNDFYGEYPPYGPRYWSPLLVFSLFFSGGALYEAPCG